MKDQMHKIIFEMICLSNEIREYVKVITKRSGYEINEMLILNTIKVYNLNNYNQLMEKVFIGSDKFNLAINSLLKKKDLILLNEGAESFYLLSERGYQGVLNMNIDVDAFFAFIESREKGRGSHVFKNRIEPLIN